LTGSSQSRAQREQRQRKAVRCNDGLTGPCSTEPYIDLSVDPVPLLGGAHFRNQRFERKRVLGRVLEPGEEVEGFTDVARMVKPTGHGREPREPKCDVMRSLFKHETPLVLRE
jgi:hypothetical protein